jgi:hypothetical protein
VTTWPYCPHTGKVKHLCRTVLIRLHPQMAVSHSTDGLSQAVRRRGKELCSAKIPSKVLNLGKCNRPFQSVKASFHRKDRRRPHPPRSRIAGTLPMMGSDSWWFTVLDVTQSPPITVLTNWGIGLKALSSDTHFTSPPRALGRRGGCVGKSGAQA